MKRMRAGGVPVGVNLPRGHTRIQFTVAKEFDGWVVKRGCCHLIGYIRKGSEGYYFDTSAKQLAAETSTQINKFIEDVNSES